ncbi:Fc receptor 5 [Pelobates cultripes]|uniref:NAD(P)(+)--arginine ADP-ribosyltransferase n=1 Tax=Pelobates cultripes TaxID=61616 RepID=A0AAD1TKJ4_PELCU|nr:Fc receptor 5 [Pelobates cultripes]
MSYRKPGSSLIYVAILIFTVSLTCPIKVDSKQVSKRNVFSTKETVLDMALSSYDDQYKGCSDVMEAEIPKLFQLEYSINREFAESWDKATYEWEDRKRHIRVPRGFKNEYAIALFAYTINGPLHKSFNEAVREAGRSREYYLKNFNFKVLHYYLTKALQELDAVETPACHRVFRGTRGVRFKSDTRKPIRFGQFTSSSVSDESALLFGEDTFFNIETCYGVKIRNFSFFPGEEEVLIPPFETFKVTQFTKEKEKNIIKLQSVEKSSFFNCEFVKGAQGQLVISLTPNWSLIFQGESITMTCNGASITQEYVCGNYWCQTMNTISDLKFRDSDDHAVSLTFTPRIEAGWIPDVPFTMEGRSSRGRSCQSGDYSLSPVIQLAEWNYLILQVPHSVYEGDSVSLRCHCYPGYSARGTIFYKDNEVDFFNWIEVSTIDMELLVKLKREYKVDRKSSKCHKCQLLDRPRVALLDGTDPWLRLIFRQYELFTYPEVSYQPNPVTKSDNVTLTCDTALSPNRADMELQFAFFRNWQNVQEFGSSNKYQLWAFQLEDTGDFNCEVQTATDSVRKKSRIRRIQIQELFSFPQIKVNSQEVTEGAEMTLTCDTISQYLTNLLTVNTRRKAYNLLFAFYSNENMVQEFSSSNKYQVQSTQLEDSGNYTCEVRTSNYNVKKRSRILYVQIIKLFSYPEIYYMPYPVKEGTEMTLTCDTALSPHRADTELQFAFYRNGQIVQELNSSNKYQIRSIQLEDAGDFTCEVETATNSVRKKSRMMYIQIQELFSSPKMEVSPQEVTEGVEMTLTCDILQYPTILLIAFYRDGEMVKGFNSSNKYQIQSAQLENSGNYTCEVRTSNHNVKKRSRVLCIQIQGDLAR